MKISVKNIISGLCGKLINTNGDPMSEALKKELSDGIEGKILRQSCKEFRGCYPDCPLDNFQVDKIILDTIYKGLRIEYQAESLQEKLPNYSKKELQKMVGDLVFTTRTYLDLFRAAKRGINWYVWSGSGACPMHKHLKDIFVHMETPLPPSILKDGSTHPFHAGSRWGCKCYVAPLVDLSPYRAPYKVFDGVKIVRMKKRDFLFEYAESLEHLNL